MNLFYYFVGSTFKIANPRSVKKTSPYRPRSQSCRLARDIPNPNMWVALRISATLLVKLTEINRLKVQCRPSNMQAGCGQKPENSSATKQHRATEKGSSAEMMWTSTCDHTSISYRIAFAVTQRERTLATARENQGSNGAWHSHSLLCSENTQALSMRTNEHELAQQHRALSARANTSDMDVMRQWERKKEGGTYVLSPLWSAVHN